MNNKYETPINIHIVYSGLVNNLDNVPLISKREEEKRQQRMELFAIREDGEQFHPLLSLSFLSFSAILTEL